MSAVEVANRLDVMSFPNSIRPARRPGAQTLRDYGFTNPASNSRDSVTLCIIDKAVGSGTYFSVYPIEVEEGTDRLLHATGRKVNYPDCRLECMRPSASDCDASPSSSVTNP
jgi:hypothetical protein